MLNRSGNTTDNLCFRYRFRDVFSRFRCCVYNGTGPLLRKHNGNMELHVSATFPFTDSCNFVLCKLYFPVQICNSPYCQPYISYNVRPENLVLDQLIIPKWIFFFILITNLADIVLIM